MDLKKWYDLVQTAVLIGAGVGAFLGGSVIAAIIVGRRSLKRVHQELTDKENGSFRGEFTRFAEDLLGRVDTNRDAAEQRFAELVERIDRNRENSDRRLSGIDQRFSTTERRFTLLDSRLGNLEQRLGAVEDGEGSMIDQQNMIMETLEELRKAGCPQREICPPEKKKEKE